MLKLKQYPLRTDYYEVKKEFGNHNAIKRECNEKDLQLIDDCKIEGRFSLEELYYMINRSSLYNLMVQGKRENITAYGSITSIVLVILLFVFGMNGEEGIAFILGVTVVFIFVGIIIARGIYNHSDFDMNNQEILKGMIYALLQDFGPKHKVNINLDCTPVRERRRIVDTYKKGTRNVKVYKKILFTLKFTIGDHTKVFLQDDHFLREQNWTKRSASGKSKAKSKSNTVDRIIYKILFDGQYYDATATAQKNNFFTLKEGMWEHKNKLKIQTAGKAPGAKVTPSDTKGELDKFLGFLQQPFLQIKKK
ncbi:hypothetical protein [Flammeovirga sp. SJP92]|uniref:hypothetical protein n=1 Tax=Flammeovirga sp. SJP92 TaxID=1775430 RepID=UPI0007871DFE|nr:hypothetical protein [Flammeovirga sp. SJP92]KXX68905.1 hypothetical protein AVL50_17245 [Flammeovirga sp. SJP92]